MSDVKMVITDLDGTLLQNDQTISTSDQDTLLQLKKLGVCRVAATGRNLYKVRQVLKPGSPFDYVIFSSGAGIIDWNTQEIIRGITIPMETTGKLIRFFIEKKYNVKVSHKIPDNHNFGWWESYPCEELTRYVEHHRKMGEAHPIDPDHLFESSQMLMFFPKTGNQFDEVKAVIQSQFSHLSLIKTTSPLNDNYVWMEIFPDSVSKARGIEEVCRITQIDQSCTLSIGNDYNDLEMLEYTAHSYVVENAPDELKKKYLISLAHTDNGFSHAVGKHIKLEETI